MTGPQRNVDRAVERAGLAVGGSPVVAPGALLKPGGRLQAGYGWNWPEMTGIRPLKSPGVTGKNPGVTGNLGSQGDLSTQQ